MSQSSKKPLLVKGGGKLRAQRQNTLSQGNSKVGKTIFTFNLPAVETCPGLSQACSDCYAQRGRWLFANVQAALARNLEMANCPSFVEEMTAEIERRQIKLVRIHSSGDFFSVAYTEKWLEIVQALPQLTFYAYTRSWRIPEIAAVLRQMADLPNFKLWLSCDADTGLPPDLHAAGGGRVAWLQGKEDEEIPQAADLIFRVHRLRKMPAKRIGLTLVCPTENGVTGCKTDCGKCGVCWK
jgi:hypothetical protein